MLASVNNNLPRVTYLKSIDNFVLVCFGFIFLTTLEYVLAIRFSQNRRAARDRKSKKILSENESVSKTVLLSHSFKRKPFSEAILRIIPNWFLLTVKISSHFLLVFVLISHQEYNLSFFPRKDTSHLSLEFIVYCHLTGCLFVVFDPTNKFSESLLTSSIMEILFTSFVTCLMLQPNNPLVK